MTDKKEVSIRNLCLEDENMIFQWISNSELRKMIGTRGIPTIESHNKWFQSKLYDCSNETYVILIENVPVGIVGTNIIDVVNRNAEMYIYIGNKEYRGKGVSKIAVDLFISYLVEKYRLHKINARIFSFNMPSLKLFEKCGFELEGIQKEQIYQSDEGKYIDLFWYSYIINEEK